MLDTDFSALGTALTDAKRDLDEFEIELRIARIQLAGGTLADSEGIKQRLHAAWAIDSDGAILLDMLQARRKQGEAEFRREALQREDLAESIQQVIDRGRADAGDMIIKSRLFYVGLHWWLRGRYGQGPDGNGLLKSQAALRSPQAQFALYMPTEMPKPTDPLDSTRHAIPEVDRRHHYIWAWEYRRLSTSGGSKSKTERSQKLTQETTMSRFY